MALNNIEKEEIYSILPFIVDDEQIKKSKSGLVGRQ